MTRLTRDILFGLLGASLVVIVSNRPCHAQPHQYTPPICADANDPTCPAQCRKDLTYILREIPIIEIPLSAVSTIKHSQTYSTYAMWLGPPMMEKHSIIIDPKFTGWFRAAILHHEACHEEMFRQTGSAKFHD